MATGIDGFQWVERHSAFNDAEHCRYVDDDFRGHSLDTLMTWRVQNTGGRGTSDLKNDDVNGVAALVTGNLAADQIILDTNNIRIVDPSLSPVFLARVKALNIAAMEMRLGLVDVLGTDDCYFLVDVSAKGGPHIFSQAHNAGGLTEDVDTTIDLDVNYHYFGLYIAADGTPYFYIDGTLRRTGAAADVDPAEYFQPYVEIDTEGAAVRTLEVDFVKGWQRRE
jgi:hypothetical protein